MSSAVGDKESGEEDVADAGLGIGLFVCQALVDGVVVEAGASCWRST
jgi:hypothetical protein